MKGFQIDEDLVQAVVRSTQAGLRMADTTPVPIGYSALPARGHEVAAMVGLVGRRNGTVTINFSQRSMLFLAGRLAGTLFETLDEQVFDAVGEIANIVAGRLKAELGGAAYGITNISCPSIIVGQDHNVYYFRGFNTASVEFEISALPTIFVRDRVFSTTVAMTQA